MLSEKVKELEQENAVLREQVKGLQEESGGMAGSPKDCGHCQHFIQHYIRSGTGYCPAYSGHCIAGSRVKGRKPGDRCKSFARKAYGENYI